MFKLKKKLSMRVCQNDTHRAVRSLTAIALLGLLAGCASSARPEQMVLKTEVDTRPFPSELLRSMCVRTVTGGEKTNPLWMSKVDNDGFRSALSSSMEGAQLVGSGDCAYPVDVNLLGLSQPAIGFDMTVTSHVNYKVFDKGGQPYLLETIDAPFTATMSDAFVGVKRLQMANEGSIRTSIEKFFVKLRDHTAASLSVAGNAAAAK
jgi:hypothetical protein